MLHIRLVGALILATVFFNPRIGSAQFSNDAKWIPGGANCVVLVSGERVFASELAKKENWADANEGSFERGTSVLPPKVGRMIIATQFDLAYMQPIWTASVLAPSDSDLELERIAANRNRPVETISDRKAMVLENDVYLVQLDGNNFGAMAPADRQRVTRWAESESSRPSPYISEALEFADKNSDVTIAFDLHGAIDPDTARSRFLNFESIKPTDVEKAAVAASRLRGFMLGITVKDKIYAALRVDFAPGTTGIDAFNKESIIEALENNGVMIEEIRDWEFASDAGTLKLNGTLSDSGLRQINSLVAQPVQAIFRGIGAESLDPSYSRANTPEVATTRYLNRIELCFKDLDRLLLKESRNVITPYQRWFSSNAEQIDMLPTDNVDPAIVEFGARVSEGFRDISQILLDAKNATKVRKANFDANSGYGYGYGNGYGYRRSGQTRQREAIKTQTYGEAAAQASEIMNQLRNDLGNVRRNYSSGN